MAAEDPGVELHGLLRDAISSLRNKTAGIATAEDAKDAENNIADRRSAIADLQPSASSAVREDES